MRRPLGSGGGRGALRPIRAFGALTLVITCATSSFTHDTAPRSTGAPTCDPAGPFGLPGLDLPPDQIGTWGPVVAWPVQATHAIVLHTGKVLFWREGEDFGEPTVTYVWSPADGSLKSVFSPSTEMFCSGHASLADGRILVGGGNDGAELGWGPVDTNFFDPATETWTRVADMSYGRYYATLTTLGDGRVVAISGQSSPGHLAAIPELYDPAADTWTSLFGAANVMSVYPQNLLIPDGRVLFTGPSKNTQALNFATESWDALPYAAYNDILGSAVQYEPGKVMKCGGGSGPLQNPFDNKTQVIDMSVPSPRWAVVAPMTYPRGWANLVLLPDGRALAVGGGTGDGYDADCAVHAAELWDPVTQTWTVMASQARPRQYHSTAILLPDGRVLSASGEHAGVGGEKNYEIYSPPYLFRGPRPVVDWAPGAVGYGDSFFIELAAADTIAKVSLLRPNAVTHAFDENQRYVPLDFSVVNKDRLEVVAPPGPDWAPPGYYLLFVLDTNDVPSVGAFTRLGACTAAADSEALCGNGEDDDCDGLTDLADPECPSFFLPPAGAVPDGGSVPGLPLLIAKLPDGRIELSWSPSCSAGDGDYAIYEGALGDFASHVPVFCSTNGATTRTFGRLGSNYYLVVPQNAIREGSYGLDSQGAERPASAMACKPQRTGACEESSGGGSR